MTLSFTKMQGAGNDYIYLNCMEKTPDNPQQLAVELSDRHFGIGGDGLVLICSSRVADAKMRMFNADGSEAGMCGNAIRCVGRYLYDHGLVEQTAFTIETGSGIKSLRLSLKDGQVVAATVGMGKAELTPQSIPVALDGSTVLDREVTMAGAQQRISCVSMGNPHCVIFGGDPSALNLEQVGPLHEQDPLFPQRTNTEFVQVLDDHTLKMRVWERGSGETFACGTGACATVTAAVKLGHCPENEEICVKMRGGDVFVRYTPLQVYLTGGCVQVFQGEVMR